MSELKAETIYLQHESGENYAVEFYIKSEADKVIAHHKHKRCLAMARWCEAESDVADADGDYEDMKWYQKWHNKWLELAEEPTWAKFLQLIHKEEK